MAIPPSEMLLQQTGECVWLLLRDGSFHSIYGDAAPVFGRAATELGRLNFIDLFGAPARVAWKDRLEGVFAGEIVEAAGGSDAAHPTFCIRMFPVRDLKGEVLFAGCVAREIAERRLVLKALAALESDRERLSRLLHDQIGQTLSAAGLQLDLLRMDLADSTACVPRRVGDIQAMLETLIEIVRDVNRELYPSTAERVGLRAALDGLAGRLRKSFQGVVRVFADATAQPAPAAAAAMYRIAQEAAAMAMERQGCSVIEILLKPLRDGCALEIRDNGLVTAGGSRGVQRVGLEAMAMQYFADKAGLTLRIETVPINGTLVRVLCAKAAASDGQSAGD